MSTMVAWARSNAVIVACLALIGLALAAFGGFWWLWSGTIPAALAEQTPVFLALEKVRGTRVKSPPRRISDPAREMRLVVNEPLFAELENVYQTLEAQRKDVVREVLLRNRPARVWFENQKEDVPDNARQLLGNELFPRGDTPTHKQNAKERYLDAIRAMLGAYGSKPAADGPRLHAGGPVDRAQIDALRKEADERVRNEARPRKREGDPLTEEETEKLRNLWRTGLVRLFAQHTRGMHIYAGNDAARPDEFPLHLGDWVNKPPGQIELAEVFDSQIWLWMTQDILSAVASLNRTREDDVNVTDLPVKRLLSLRPMREAIGEGAGGVRPVRSVPPGQPLPRDFYNHPTGRISNSLFDVRRAQLKVVMDSRHIPALFNNLHSAGLITVTSYGQKDVDEAQAMGEGYIYGNADCVELDLELETIWFRQWLDPLDPRKAAR